MRASRRDSSRGQSMVEFALVAPVLLLFIFGVIDFGRYYAASEGVLQASRAGVRYAIVHPTSWSNAASAPSNTIQGQIQAASGPASIINDDSHITITYYDVSGGSAVQCGSYSASSNTWVSANGYAQSACVIPGSMIQVSVTYLFQLYTPPFNSMNINTTITQTTQLIEEQ